MPRIVAEGRSARQGGPKSHGATSTARLCPSPSGRKLLKPRSLKNKSATLLLNERARLALSPHRMADFAGRNQPEGEATVRRLKFCLLLLNLGPALMLSFGCAASAQTAGQAHEPGAEPFRLCNSSMDGGLPSAWIGKAISSRRAWDCGTNLQRSYVGQLSLQLFLNVARSSGIFTCGTSRRISAPVPGIGVGTVNISSARTAVITRLTVNGSRYVLRVVFCDDHDESCDLRGRKVRDRIAGSYVCRRGGKRIDDGTWAVEPMPKPLPVTHQIL